MKKINSKKKLAKQKKLELKKKLELFFLSYFDMIIELNSSLIRVKLIEALYCKHVELHTDLCVRYWLAQKMAVCFFASAYTLFVLCVCTLYTLFVLCVCTVYVLQVALLLLDIILFCSDSCIEIWNSILSQHYTVVCIVHNSILLDGTRVKK